MNSKNSRQSRSSSARATKAVFSVLLAAGLFMGCSEDGPLAARESVSGPLGLAAIVDVSGIWNWSNVEELTVPVFVAEIFGLPIEGPITHFRCESSGTMTLFQVGASFSGPVDRTTISCLTNGGIAFVPPPAFSPPFFEIEDGRIVGKSIHFVFGGAPFPTPSHGVISGTEHGTATALKATGRTIVPGHPKSPLPQAPPPAGTSKMIQWEAERALP